MNIKESHQTEKRNSEVKLRQILKIIMVSIAILFFVFVFVQQWFFGLHPDLFQQIIDHYAVFLTLPCAGFAALLLVVIFDQAYGQIKFSIWGMNFEGASGPIILWIMCYLSIILSVRALW